MLSGSFFWLVRFYCGNEHSNVVYMNVSHVTVRNFKGMRLLRETWTSGAGGSKLELRVGVSFHLKQRYVSVCVFQGLESRNVSIVRSGGVPEKDQVSILTYSHRWNSVEAKFVINNADIQCARIHIVDNGDVGVSAAW
jgi:hypothetical protein